MTRRGLLLIPFSKAVSAPQDGGREAANHFATLYNEWVSLLRERSNNLVNAKEFLAWRRVLQAWHELNKAVKY